MPHLKNRAVLRLWRDTNPSLEDLKRAVLIEVFRARSHLNKSPLHAYGRGVSDDLIVAIQRMERSEINANIMDVLTASEK